MKMTATGPYKISHSQFGGLVYPSDFNTECRKRNNASGSPIAKRIAGDRQFDEQCRKRKECVSYQRIWY